MKDIQKVQESYTCQGVFLTKNVYFEDIVMYIFMYGFIMYQFLGERDRQISPTFN